NLVGRADLLAAIGVLGALLCHTRAGATDGPERSRWSAGLVVASGVAFFSNETGLTLVGMLLAYDFLVRRRVEPRAYAGVVAVLLLYLGMRWWVTRTGLPAAELSPVDNPIVGAGPLAALATAVKVLGR